VGMAKQKTTIYGRAPQGGGCSTPHGQGIDICRQRRRSTDWAASAALVLLIAAGCAEPEEPNPTLDSTPVLKAPIAATTPTATEIQPVPAITLAEAESRSLERLDPLSRPKLVTSGLVRVDSELLEQSWSSAFLSMREFKFVYVVAIQQDRLLKSWELDQLSAGTPIPHKEELIVFIVDAKSGEHLLMETSRTWPDLADLATPGTLEFISEPIRFASQPPATSSPPPHPTTRQTPGGTSRADTSSTPDDLSRTAEISEELDQALDLYPLVPKSQWTYRARAWYDGSGGASFLVTDTVRALVVEAPDRARAEIHRETGVVHGQKRVADGIVPLLPTSYTVTGGSEYSEYRDPTADEGNVEAARWPVSPGDILAPPGEATATPLSSDPSDWYSFGTWFVDAIGPTASEAGNWDTCATLVWQLLTGGTLAWFCPGVGWVKVEMSHTYAFVGTLELVDFKRGTVVPSDRQP
jgi:hypothetical protein